MPNHNLHTLSHMGAEGPAVCTVLCNHSMINGDDACGTGAGEDVEQALLRISTQATEAALLRDRQAQLDRDNKVLTSFE